MKSGLCRMGQMQACRALPAPWLPPSPGPRPLLPRCRRCPVAAPAGASAGQHPRPAHLRGRRQLLKLASGAPQCAVNVVAQAAGPPCSLHFPGRVVRQAASISLDGWCTEQHAFLCPAAVLASRTPVHCPPPPPPFFTAPSLTDECLRGQAWLGCGGGTARRAARWVG